jgi:predicted nucleic acid-binding Zn ribbon protein
LNPKALNHRASENKAKNEADYVKWVESFTPDQIRIANNARISIKKRLSASGIKFKQGSYSQIKDSRQPHPHIAATNIFIREKHATGDFKGIGFAEASAQLHREWKAMSEAEKKV